MLHPRVNDDHFKEVYIELPLGIRLSTRT